MKPSYYSLFKSYDIRGTYPIINGTIAYWVGFSFIKEILEKENLPLEVNVLRDHRLSSPELYKAMVQGIKDAGGTPICLGLGSTDMLYASTQVFNNAGVMLTASHNPAPDNGIKIVKKAPQVLGLETGLATIRDSEYLQSLKEIDLNSIPDPKEDIQKKQELIVFYENKVSEIGLIGQIKDKLTARKLKIVADTANGMGGLVMKSLIHLYPEIEFIPLFWELDGSYPNHTANPLIDENIIDLQKSVIENKADFGIAFDGDCDRVFFVDENGKRLIGDHMVALLAQYFLENKMNGQPELSPYSNTIVYNIPASRCTKDITESLGGKARASKQGHNHMKSAMAEENSLYGGEHSGHHYFGQFGFMDGGIFAVAAFLNLYISKGQKASELTQFLRGKYLLSGELNFTLFDEMDPETRIKIIDDKLKQKYSDAKFDYLDGISVLYPDWKLNIRFSNTEPLLRLNVEIINNGDKTEQDVANKVQDIKSLLGLN